ncbi:flagellar motor protein MotB [Dongia deserti]|uniref:flagellar motor protein MotB n=1 Tax=Dongia deserti TaxID=2268030 RepID=UPI000E64A82E|nr:flagellar motor protein MotB [Dongia deserti]
MDVISDTIDPARAHAASDGTANSAPGEAQLTQAIRWRPPSLPTAPRVHQPRNPSLPSFAGLMTLILTFFIVLASMSLHDKTKTDAAIASVQEAFGNAIPVEEPRERTDEDILRDYIVGLTQRIQSLVPLMGGKPAPASDHQVLWLPAELVFPDQDVTLAPVFPTVLREVVNSLDGVPQRFMPHIEMRLCAAEPSDQVRARAVAIGAALAGERAPLKQFSIGIARCDPARIGIAVALTSTTDDAVPAAEEQAP